MLIQFETAKLAKEKGCDLFGIEAYSWEGSCISTESSFYREDKYPFNAPTQSELQKWLREKHGIHVTPIPSYTDDTFNKKYFFEIAVERHIKLNKDMSNYYFKTYEEALEQGLLEGLKIIK